MHSNVVGLDIAKSIFHLYSLSAEGKAVKKKLKRVEMLAYFANLPASLMDGLLVFFKLPLLLA